MKRDIVPGAVGVKSKPGNYPEKKTKLRTWVQSCHAYVRAKFSHSGYDHRDFREV